MHILEIIVITVLCGMILGIYTFLMFVVGSLFLKTDDESFWKPVAIGYGLTGIVILVFASLSIIGHW